MEEIIEQAKRSIPSLDNILEEALKDLNEEELSSNFGEALLKVEKSATDIFKMYERNAMITLAKEWVKNQKEELKERLRGIVEEEGWDKFVQKASELFSEFALLVQALEKDLGNMRKARGGRTFEKLVLKLLQALGIEGETPQGEAREKLGRIDIVIPSVEVALETPDRAFFLACKRTLRERWKQEVPIAQPNQRVYLITIDEELPERKAIEIKEKGLIAFVWDDLKEQEHLIDRPWIRKLSDLPKELRR